MDVVTPHKATNDENQAHVESYYIDANTLLSLKQHTEIPILAAACKNGHIKVYLSEIAVYEFARNVFSQKTKDPLAYSLPPEEQKKYLQDLIKNFYAYFQDNRIVVLPYDPERHSDQLNRLLSSEGAYFKPDDNNDCRDAQILAIALCDLDPKNIKYLGYDRNLSKIFKESGFDTLECVIQSQEDVKKFITQVIGGKTGKQNFSWTSSKGRIKTIPDSILSIAQQYDPDYFPLLKASASSSETKQYLNDALNNLSSEDRNYRELVMAYVHALAPVDESRLIQLVGTETRGHIVRSNIERLISSNIFLRIGKQLIPSSAKQGGSLLCEAAFYARIDDVLNLL